MSDVNYVTKETLERMRKELSVLKTTGRAEIARQIGEAREKGDLKENAEYDAAKEAQGHHEAKISVLQTAIVTARIIDAKDLDASKVSILSKVIVTNMKVNKRMEYQIVSESEADLKSKKISVTSPIGKGLLGKEPGDIAEVQTPGGVLQLRVESITL